MGKVEKCGFFDAHVIGKEYDRVYLADSFASYFASFIGNGVFGGDSGELQVKASPDGGMYIIVQPGQGWINGYWYENTTNYTFRLKNADGVLNRKDIVVLRWGLKERAMNVVVKEGAFAVDATKPSIQRDADYYELQLAEISIRAGAVNIFDSDITDTRLDDDLCGVVTGVVKQISTSEYGSQLNGFIERYIQNANQKYDEYTGHVDTKYNSFVQETDEKYQQYVDDTKAKYDQYVKDTDDKYNQYVNDTDTKYEKYSSDTDEKYSSYLEVIEEYRSEIEQLLEFIKQEAAEGDFVAESEKGKPNGVPNLDETGKVPSEQLPDVVIPDPVNSAKVADALKVPRVSNDTEYDITTNKSEMKEFVKTASNLPSDSFYHILSTDGDDKTYETQLALGMTKEDVEYRVKQENIWGEWLKLAFQSDVDQDAMFLAYISGIKGHTFYLSQTVGDTVMSRGRGMKNTTGAKTLIFNAMISNFTEQEDTLLYYGYAICTADPDAWASITEYGLWSKIEGKTPKGRTVYYGRSGAAWETYSVTEFTTGGKSYNLNDYTYFEGYQPSINWVLSLADFYLFDDVNGVGSVNQPIDADTLGGGVLGVEGGWLKSTLPFQAGEKARMWSDGEGGNIRLYTANGNVYYEIDGAGNYLRMYRANSSDNSGVLSVLELRDTPNYEVRVNNILNYGLTANTALIADGSKMIKSSATTSTELGYVHGVTSSIQTQINNLKNSVSNGKASVANAITAKGVPTATNADFSVLAANIGKIQTGAVKEDKYQMFDKGDTVNLFGFLSTDNNSNFIMPAYYADSWVFHSKDANAQANWGERIYFNGVQYSGQQTRIHFAGSKITSSSYLNQCLFETNDDSTNHLYKTADNLYPPRILVLIEKLAEGSFTMTYLAVTRATLQNGIVYESRKGNGMQFKIYVTATSGYASQISKIRVYANKLGSNPSSDHINLGIIIFY